MMKRICAILLCAVLMIAALPANVLADQEVDAKAEEKQRICKQITNTYWRTMSAAGVDNLAGYCGEMAGWELYFLGVTTYPVRQNGNEMYDVFTRDEVTSAGYQVDAYHGSQYTMEEALNTITQWGTRDVYNIMLGFDWTETAAGSLYGHVSVIHAIIDGTVYFTEGFITPFNTNPSQAMICSIEELARYYESWTSFEGLVYFGKEPVEQSLKEYPSDLFLSGETETDILTQAVFEGEILRTAAPAERLHAVALVEAPDGGLYYRVEDFGRYGYVPADKTQVERMNFDGIAYTGGELPTALKSGEDYTFSGDIAVEHAAMQRTTLLVTDSTGKEALSWELPKAGRQLDMSRRYVNTQVDLSTLKTGNYTLSLVSYVENNYVKDGVILPEITPVTVASGQLSVGEAVAPRESIAVTAAVYAPHGWVYEEGSWRCYDEGQLRTGWYCDKGVDYYLQEDGSAATGWVEINGKMRLFSETGAMRTGWVETPEGKTQYLMSNGAPAQGWMTIEGELYFFDTHSCLVTNTTMGYEGKTYHLGEDGVATR